MQTPPTRPDFTPPPEGGLMRSFGMALLAHAVLLLALSWGVKWKRDEPAVAVEAELWANAPQQAAPKPVEAPPAPPAPPPAPPAPPQPSQAQRDAEIALQEERERQREEQERARREEAEKQRKLAEDRRRQQEEARREEEQRRIAAEQQKRKEEEQRIAAEKKRKEEQARARKRQEEEEDKKLAELREQNLRRIQGLAGATGPREATGTAIRSAGPSATYAGRLAAHFQRHVVYPGGVDTIAGNPLAVVQVRVSPTGEIMSARLTKSSGNPSWDEAAVRAIERSERIPADVDGRYVTEFPVEMRPKR